MVVERAADGKVAVQCHDTQQAALSHAQGVEDIQLGEARGCRDGGTPSEQGVQQCGRCGADVPEFQEGEDTDEEVHGRGQARICLDQDDDEHVPCQGEEVDAQGPQERERSQGPRGRETSEGETLGPCVVVMIHDFWK